MVSSLSSLWPCSALSHQCEGVLATYPKIASALGNATNVTFLAPNNDAMNALLADPVTSTLIRLEEQMEALLFYHLLNGTYRTGDFSDEDRFIPTYLTNDSYTSLDEGQRIQAERDNNNVTFTSYGKSNASVVTSVCLIAFSPKGIANAECRTSTSTVAPFKSSTVY